MTTYEQITTFSGDEYIKKIEENGVESFIPKDESNADYQRYLHPEVEQLAKSVKP